MSRVDFIIKSNDLKSGQVDSFYQNLAAAIANSSPITLSYTGTTGNIYSAILGDSETLWLRPNREIHNNLLTFIKNLNHFLCERKKLNRAREYYETQKEQSNLEISERAFRVFNEATVSYLHALEKLPKQLQTAIISEPKTIANTSTTPTVSNETTETTSSVSALSDETTDSEESSRLVSLSQSFDTNPTSAPTHSDPEPELDALNRSGVISAGMPYPTQVATPRATAQAQAQALPQRQTTPPLRVSPVEVHSKQPETQTFLIFNPIIRFFSAIGSAIYDAWSSFRSEKSIIEEGGESHSDEHNSKEPAFNPEAYAKQTTQEATRAGTSEFPTPNMSEKELDLDRQAIDLAPIESPEKSFFTRAIEAMRSLFFSKESPNLSGEEMLSADFWLEGPEMRKKLQRSATPQSTSSVHEPASNNSLANTPPAILPSTTSAPQPSVSQSNPPGDSPAAGPAMHASHMHRPDNRRTATPPVASSVEVTETRPLVATSTVAANEKQIAFDVAKKLCAADNVGGFKLSIQKTDPRRTDATIDDIAYNPSNMKTTTTLIATPSTPSAVTQQSTKLILSHTENSNGSITRKLETDTAMNLETLFAILAKHAYEEHLVKNNGVLPEAGLSITVSLNHQATTGNRLSDAEEKLAKALITVGFKEVVCRGIKRPESMPITSIVRTQTRSRIPSPEPNNSSTPEQQR